MTAPYRVLVIGLHGQLARELARARWPGSWTVTFAGRPELDLQCPDKAAAFVAAAKADVVINTAAYTDVEKAESEPGLAALINADAPGAMAAVCAQTGSAFVTISTDYVFDGAKGSPYIEDDGINPLNVYGRSKARGETLVRENAARHVILRTSWVFSPFGTNFVKTMTRLGRERRELRIVGDQQSCPTAAGDLAGSVVAICQAIERGQHRFGTYHVSNTESATWHEFAMAIFKHTAARGETTPEHVAKITTAEYPTKAVRPANSILDCSRIRTAYGVVMRPWRDALADCLDEMAAESAKA